MVLFEILPLKIFIGPNTFLNNKLFWWAVTPPELNSRAYTRLLLLFILRIRGMLRRYDFTNSILLFRGLKTFV